MQALSMMFYITIKNFGQLGTKELLYGMRTSLNKNSFPLQYLRKRERLNLFETLLINNRKWKNKTAGFKINKVDMQRKLMS